MKFTTLGILSLAFLSACEAKSTEDTSSSNDTPNFEVINLTVTSAECNDEEPPEESLYVYVNSESVVQVSHSNVLSSACLNFDVEASLDGNDVNLSYIEVGEPCDCTSTYTLAYDIQGLESGIFRLQLPGNMTEDVNIQ